VVQTQEAALLSRGSSRKRQVLFEYLERDRAERHSFRGQNRHFLHNAPSAVRAAARLSDGGAVWVPLASDHWASATEREQARYDLRAAALRMWGPVVGNIVCQQYGVTSDAYDITGDPTVAAFFATCQYPRYQPFVPASDASLGVICRFTIDDVLLMPNRTQGT
jgi:hypothetical protein